MFDSDLITNPYKTYADRRLSAILMDDEFGIISSSDALVIEANGSITQRLLILEKAVTSSV